jgi:hypothetical protein
MNCSGVRYPKSSPNPEIEVSDEYGFSFLLSLFQFKRNLRLNLFELQPEGCERAD